MSIDAAAAAGGCCCDVTAALTLCSEDVGADSDADCSAAHQSR